MVGTVFLVKYNNGVKIGCYLYCNHIFLGLKISSIGLVWIWGGWFLGYPWICRFLGNLGLFLLGLRVFLLVLLVDEVQSYELEAR
jgi:hypothetical protein